MNTLFNKVLGENEKCVFYFYLKTEVTLANAIDPFVKLDGLISHICFNRLLHELFLQMSGGNHKLIPSLLKVSHCMT